MSEMAFAQKKPVLPPSPPVDSVSSANIGLINTTISGLELLCVNAPSEYRAEGSGSNVGCFDSAIGAKWTITHSDGTVVFQPRDCVNGVIKQEVNPSYMELTTVTGALLTYGSFCGRPNAYNGWLNGRTINIRWNKAGTYRMEAQPGGTEGISFCKTAVKIVTVLAPNTLLAVADNLSGDRYPQCNVNTNVTYSIPAVSWATSYVWEFFSTRNLISGTFNGSSSIVTTTPNATATFNSVNASADGTLRVTARGPCGATGSRTFNIFRISPSSSVTSSGGGSCSRCFTAPSGSNYSWTLSGPSALYIDGSSSSQSVCVRSRSAGSWGGYLGVSYNGGCGGERINTGVSVSISACSGRLSAEKRPATEEFTESVSPNPANDVLTITHPVETFEIILTDMLGRQAHRQTATGHECQAKVGQLPGGLYILQIRVGNLIQSQHRIVVAH